MTVAPLLLIGCGKMGGAMLAGWLDGTEASGGVSVEQMEDLVEVALGESERFFPAFQFVIWGGKTAEEAVASSLLDVQGEA